MQIVRDFLEKIFSISDTDNQKHKVVTICFLKFKFKKRQGLSGCRLYPIQNCGTNNQLFFIDENNKKQLIENFAPLPIKIFGSNNLCVIPQNVNWLNSEIIIKSNNSSFIMNNTYKNAIVNFYVEINHGDEQEIFIDENFTMGGGGYVLP